MKKTIQLSVITLVVALCHGATQEKFLQDLQDTESRHDPDINIKEGLAAHDSETSGSAVLQSLKIDQTLEELDPIKLPFFWMLTPSTISLCFNDIEFGGFGKFTCPLCDLLANWPGLDNVGDIELPFNRTHVSISLYTDTIYLHSENYIAGGYVGSLPFNGESKFTIDMMKPTIGITYERDINGPIDGNFCVRENTTEFLVTFEDILVEFQDINPTTDTEETINSVLSSFASDVGRWLTAKLNGELQESLETIVMGVVATIFEDCPKPAKELQLPRLLNMDEKASLKERLTAFNELMEDAGKFFDAESMLDSIIEKLPY